MAKVMIFIDGTWLYSNLPRLSKAYGQEDYHVDFGKLPQVLAEEVGKELGVTQVDVVRTYLFGSYASNYDLRDEDAVERRLDFFDLLKEEYHYELEIFPINYRGRRLKREDRNPEDPFEPKEKCVDLSLATSILYFAAIPYAYDVAMAVVGDQDYKPVLQHVRRLGKRVAIASIKGSCTPEFADPRDEARVKDFDIIWIDDLLHSLELKYERHQLECESPTHKGDRRTWTTFHPRKGQRFYCPACRTEFARQKQEAQREFVSSGADAAPSDDAPETSNLGTMHSGTIKRKVADRGYGFIQTYEGKDYFFHFTDLEPGFDFEDTKEGQPVDFEVKKEPLQDKAGAAQKVRPHAG
ncbi:MAG: cold shock domain-containing protein [Candidatus Zixiibacteriota bacterium]